MRELKKIIVFALVVVFMVSMLFIGTSCKEEAAPAEEAVEEAAPAEEVVEEAVPAEEVVEEEAAEELVIGRMMVFVGDDFQQTAKQHFLNYCDEIGAEGIVLDSNFDEETERKNAEDLISRGVNAIIIQCVNAFSGAEISKSAKAAGIPVVSSIIIPDTENYILVTLDEETANKKAGKKIIELWEELHPDIPPVPAYISIPWNEWVTEVRTIPFIEGIKSVEPDIEVMEIELGADQLDTESIMAVFEDTITAHPEINVIGGFASFTTLPALEVLLSIGRGTIETELIASIEGSIEEYKKIMDPNSAYKFTTGLKPKDLEVTDVEYALKLINGEIGIDEAVIKKIPCLVLDSDSDWGPYLKEQWFEDIED